MAVINKVIEVSRPRSEAFAYVANFESVAEWDPGVAAAARTDRGDLGVGATFNVDVLFRGKTLPMRYEIVEYQPDDVVALRGEGSTVTAIDTVRFFDTPDGTRIDYTADLRMKGLLRFVEPFLGKAFDQLGEKAMAGLQAALDA